MTVDIDPWNDTANPLPVSAALVTGAAAGIGAATARLLAARGFRVALADLNAHAVQNMADEIVANGGQALALPLDVRDAAAVDDAIETASGALGPVTRLAAVAGVSARGSIETLAREDWAKVMEINVTGSYNVIRAVLPGMREAGGGSIVLTGSTASISGFPNSSAYTTAKHALAGMTRSLCIETGPAGIRVNVVAPGSIATDRARGSLSTDFALRVLDRTPLRRHGRPEEVAEAIAFLLSDSAAFVNGAVIPIDGGLSAGHLTSVL